MIANLPNSNSKKLASAPKARVGSARKPARLRGFSALSPVHWTGEPGPNVAQQRPFPGPPVPTFRPPGPALGEPLSINQVAELLGCSPWTVRQTLIPRGLPHFRFSASGRLTFFQGQVVRWIENQQQAYYPGVKR
jgi:hypothetical protein